MANVRIDNMSGDTVTVLLNGKSYIVRDEEKFYIDAVEKGEYSLRIHRTRVPLESSDIHETAGDGLTETVRKNEKSLHTQLDSEFVLTINSSKSVVTIESGIRMQNSLGIDVIFSGYTASVSGGRIEEKRSFFANKNVEKHFVFYHIKEAFMPVGLIALFLLFMGIFTLHANIIGKVMTIGGTKFTYPWAVGLTVVAAAMVIYTVVIIINIALVAKRHKIK